MVLQYLFPNGFFHPVLAKNVQTLLLAYRSSISPGTNFYCPLLLLPQRTTMETPVQE
jgi:hypothetical protein